jgi:hypothetical protein
MLTAIFNFIILKVKTKESKIHKEINLFTFPFIIKKPKRLMNNLPRDNFAFGDNKETPT